jgi:hypothetical protein
MPGAIWIMFVWDMNNNMFCCLLAFDNQGHTSCLDSDTDNDYDLHDELLQTQRLSLGLKNYGSEVFLSLCSVFPLLLSYSV